MQNPQNCTLQINGFKGKRDKRFHGDDKKRCQSKIDAKVFHGETSPADAMIWVDTRARMHKSSLTMVFRIILSTENTLPTSAKPARPRGVVQNANLLECVPRVDAIKHQTMHEALMKVLPRTKPGHTQAELGQQMPAHLSQEGFPGSAKARWRVKCVQLDLEKDGVITRNSAAKPLRWLRLQ